MKMKVCLEKLDEVRSGKLLSHRALPNTEQFMASVILRRIRLLSKCGHTEKVGYFTKLAFGPVYP